MARKQVLAFVLLFWPIALQAQYLAVSGGGVFPRDLKGSAQSGGTTPRAEFSNSSQLSIDGGAGVLPFVGLQIHYGLSHRVLTLTRGDAIGSTARVDLTSHTLTFDGRLHTPAFAGFRLYGLMGGGFSRIHLDVRQQVENPFPGGPPDDVFGAVFDFGGGVEQGFLPFLKWRLEFRDDVMPIPEDFFLPGGSWHRPQVTVGIVVGR